jgi:hypothetical protein
MTGIVVAFPVRALLVVEIPGPFDILGFETLVFFAFISDMRPFLSVIAVFQLNGEAIYVLGDQPSRRAELNTRFDWDAPEEVHTSSKAGLKSLR